MKIGSMRLTKLSDSMILCESPPMTFSDSGVWADEGILTGNLRRTYLTTGSVYVTRHEKAVFNKLVRELDGSME